MLVGVLSSEDEARRDELKRARGVVRSLLCKEHVILRKTKPDHVFEGRWESWGGARCEVCGENLGWYCPESPDGLCEYVDAEGCIHCGEPSERK